MTNRSNLTRRSALGAGTAAAATIFIPRASRAAIPPKKRGETRVVYLGGDQLHNGFCQEFSIRYTFKDTDWTIAAATDARQITPELLKDTDLLMITRWGGPLFSWTFGPLAWSRPSLTDRDDGYMTDELEDAIVENVTSRGMGFMGFHCTAWTPDRKKFNDMLGIEGIMHGPVQDVKLHTFNEDHPITRGITDFTMPLDENFGVNLTSPKAVKLFESTGQKDNRNNIAGWANESGKGRAVGLVAGHTDTAWTNATYMELRWRGAHWALGREIPHYKRPDKAWF